MMILFYLSTYEHRTAFASHVQHMLVFLTYSLQYQVLSCPAKICKLFCKIMVCFMKGRAALYCACMYPVQKADPLCVTLTKLHPETLLIFGAARGFRIQL